MQFLIHIVSDFSYSQYMNLLPKKFIGYELQRKSLTSSVYYVAKLIVEQVECMFYDVKLDSSWSELMQEAYRVGFIDECAPNVCSIPGTFKYMLDPYAIVYLTITPYSIHLACLDK